jgi:hypothetical protein
MSVHSRIEVETILSKIWHANNESDHTVEEILRMLAKNHLN